MNRRNDDDTFLDGCTIVGMGEEPIRIIIDKDGKQQIGCRLRGAMIMPFDLWCAQQDAIAAHKTWRGIWKLIKAKLKPKANP